MSKEEKSSQRKPAPPIAPGYVSPRAEIIESLNKENPKSVHAFVAGDKKPRELKDAGQEVVKGANGDPLTHMGDIVVRMDRETFETSLKSQAEQSRDQVESVVKREKSTVTRNPKKPKE